MWPFCFRTGEDDGVTGEIGARAMDERAALLSRAVADVEERTHVDSRRRWGRSTKARASGGANGSAMRGRGADGVESVADDRTEVEDEDYGTGPSSPTIVDDDDAAVLDRDRGGWRHRRVSSLWALIGVASVASVAVVATRGYWDGGLLGTVGAKSFPSAEPPSAVLTSQDSHASTETKHSASRAEPLSPPNDVTKSDPRLAGHSRQEVAEAIKMAVDIVHEEQEHEREMGHDKSAEVGGLGTDELAITNTWDTPTHLMARPGSHKDRDDLKVTLSKLLTNHDVGLVSKNVKITASVNPKMWPEGLDRAVYALKTVFEVLGYDYLHPDFSALKGLDWIEAPNSRDLDGKIAGAWAALSKHVGTLFGHMYQWQLAKDAGNTHTIIVDTGGLSPSTLGVPVSSFGAIVDHAPEDFDVILLNAYPDVTGSHTVAEFPDHKGHDLKLSTWDSPGHTGLSSYIISSTFPDRVFEYAAKKGAGYLDSWIVDELCTHPSCDAAGNIVGLNALTATQPLLKCYRAHGVIDHGFAKHAHKASKEEQSSSSHEEDVLGVAGALIDDVKKDKERAAKNESEFRNDEHKMGSKKDQEGAEKDGKKAKKDDESKDISSKGRRNKDEKNQKDKMMENDEKSGGRPDEKAAQHSKKSNGRKDKSKSSNKDDEKKKKPNAAKEVKDFFKFSNEASEASLGSVPRFVRQAHPTSNEAENFVQASQLELKGQSGSLKHKKLSMLHANKLERTRVEDMVKRIHQFRTQGQEATTEDILGHSAHREGGDGDRVLSTSTDGHDADAVNSAAGLTQTSEMSKTSAPDSRNNAERRQATLNAADAEVAGYLRGLV